ncbi:MAG: ABC transporter ATP-binding protein [Zhenhengia sp.]
MLESRKLTLGYEHHMVIKDLSFCIKPHTITTIIGPNGCGKSTLLKALSKNKKIASGDIFIDNQSIYRYSHKTLAKKLAILPQSPLVPDDFLIRDLVSYGRNPYLDWMGRLKEEDYRIIDWAINETGITHLQNRKMSTMSGGERQSAWIAMALAQQPEILLLDEPTTYLDIAHQHEVLELIKRINGEMGITVVMVLHDINQASRYSDRIIAMKEGYKVIEGSPKEVVTKEILKEIFGIDANIYEEVSYGYPYFIVK